MLQVIESLPDDADVEEAIERLYLLFKIRKGMAQADRGETISQDEARHRMSRWFTFPSSSERMCESSSSIATASSTGFAMMSSKW